MCIFCRNDAYECCTPKLPADDGSCYDTSGVQHDRTCGTRKIVDEYLAAVTKSDVEAKYGPMGAWDVTQITSMNFLFNNKNTFNTDISKWNVAQVTNTEKMFVSNAQFNADLSKMGYNFSCKHEQNVSKCSQI